MSATISGFLAADVPNAPHLILVTVNGQVTYAGEVTNAFNQVFILGSEGKDLRIMYDCYRYALNLYSACSWFMVV